MIRLGLCCIFKEHPVKFRRTTATYLSKLSSEKQRARLSELCLINADSLMQSLEYCYKNGIGDFRINSQILPLKTHPDVGYAAERLLRNMQSGQPFTRISLLFFLLQTPML